MYQRNRERSSKVPGLLRVTGRGWPREPVAGAGTEPPVIDGAFIVKHKMKRKHKRQRSLPVSGGKNTSNEKASPHCCWRLDFSRA